MIVDTQGLFPAGKDYVMTVSAVPEENNRKGYVFWDFTFDTEVEGIKSTYQESFPIWLAGPIFKALQFKEVSLGRYEVEPTLALGRKIKGDVIHEEVKGTPRARLKNMVPMADSDIPF